jgi:hypothetical protein
MKTRVTITLDPLVHQRAKRVARARRTSVSGLIESLLETAAPAAPSSAVDRIVGSASLRSPAVGTDPLYEALVSKHLKP